MLIVHQNVVGYCFKMKIPLKIIYVACCKYPDILLELTHNTDFKYCSIVLTHVTKVSQQINIVKAFITIE